VMTERDLRREVDLTQVETPVEVYLVGERRADAQPVVRGKDVGGLMIEADPGTHREIPALEDMPRGLGEPGDRHRVVCGFREDVLGGQLGRDESEGYQPLRRPGEDVGERIGPRDLVERLENRWRHGGQVLRVTRL